MNREDIIRMAQEAGFRVNTTESLLEELERFAALVASAERNRCVARADIALLGADKALSDRVLKAIRARGQA